MNLFKKLLGIIICLTIIGFSPAFAKETTPWLIYVYMTGSNLESEDGSATDDLIEMSKAGVGKNVKILVAAGGANEWKNEIVSSDELGIYEIKGDDMSQIATLNNSNMGKRATLEEFLRLGESKYKPEHRILIFWNHGSGPAGGINFDENHNDNFLHVKDVNDAINNAFNGRSKVFDIIGFDECLMANLETAYWMTRWGHVMTGSEELEPGTGWNYTPWLKALEKNPNMSSQEVGINIAKSYMKYNRSYDEEDVTFSVISLDRFPSLALAFTNLGYKMLDAVKNDHSAISTIDRSGMRAESYGARSKNEGYTDSIDLGQYLDNLTKIAPSEVKKVKEELKNTIIYHDKGSYKKSTGLSVYYPIGKGKENFDYVVNYGFPTPQKIIYGWQVGRNSQHFTNNMNNNIKKATDFLKAQAGQNGGSVSSYEPTQAEENLTNQGSVTSLFSFLDNNHKSGNIEDLEDIKLSINDEGYSYVKVDKKYLNNIALVENAVMYFVLPGEDKELEDGIYLMLGSDNQLTLDWDKGIFTEHFDNTWPSLDGHILPVIVNNSNDDYTTYDCEVLVNGKRQNIIIVQDLKNNKFGITGMQTITDGIPGRITNLKPGDKITTLFPIGTLTSEEEDNNDEQDEQEFETFEYKKDSRIVREDIGEGHLLNGFIFTDTQGNSATSALMTISADEDGNLKRESVDSAFGGILNSDDSSTSSTDSDDEDEDSTEDNNNYQNSNDEDSDEDEDDGNVIGNFMD